ncbi:MAG: hypothetical protein WC455_29500 [Dehalococcoidia bacterium]|jgi:hypothetical protein
MPHEPCNDIFAIKKVLYGNGVTGMIKKVEDHEKYILKQMGSLSTIKWLLIFVGIGNIALILKAFLK